MDSAAIEEANKEVTAQGGGTPLQSVLRAATMVKIKVNSQLEIFSIVNSQATISL